MQGGIHPDFTGETYLRILEAAKAGAPGIHVHAFSPLEVTQVGISLNQVLDVVCVTQGEHMDPSLEEVSHS